VARPQAERRRFAALLQATSLSFLVVAGQIGVQLQLLRPAVYAALVAAGLLTYRRRAATKHPGLRYATVAADSWTALAASRITSSTKAGWESIGTWLLSTS
jgi:hypothetical protein